MKYFPFNTLGTFYLKKLPHQIEMLSICSLQNQIHSIDILKSFICQKRISTRYEKISIVINQICQVKNVNSINLKELDVSLIDLLHSMKSMMVQQYIHVNILNHFHFMELLKETENNEFIYLMFFASAHQLKWLKSFTDLLQRFTVF